MFIHEIYFSMYDVSDTLLGLKYVRIKKKNCDLSS